MTRRRAVRSAAAAGLVVLALLRAVPAAAINANPNPVDLAQPDGTPVRLHVRGDEWAHWWEDMQGYAVVMDHGAYVYARLDADGALVTTGARVGAADPATLGLAQRLHPSVSWIEARTARMQPSPRRAALTPPNGVVKNLVVLAQFADHGANLTLPMARYDTLFNQPGGTLFSAPTGSVRDAWLEYSRTKLDLRSTIADWVVLPHTEAYYANADSGLGGNCPTCSAQLVIDALNALNTRGFDFGPFDANGDGYIDAISIIHSGYGSEVDGNPNHIWSHKGSLPADWDSGDNNAYGQHVKVNDHHIEPALWSNVGNAIAHIGVITHETGHFFGLPDLYDRDGSSSGDGSFCLMSNSWGWTGTQYYPPHPSAWCKILLGWNSPIVATTPGVFALDASEAADAIVKIPLPNAANEYLLIENRQPIGFDALPGPGGLAIWHIDDNLAGSQPNDNEGFPGQPGWPGNGNHYKVALLAADGTYDLERKINLGDMQDLYRNVPGIALNERSLPTSDSYVGFPQPTGYEISQISAAGARMTFRFRPAKWVQFGYPGAQAGTFLLPYSSMANALLNVADDSVILCKAGTTSEKPTLNRLMWIKSYGGTAQFGP